MNIVINPDMLQSLKRHAEEAFPQECCGILLGRRADDAAAFAHQVQPATNVAEGDRTRSYQIDWKTLVDAVRSSRDSEDQIVGFYHSHPDGSSRPSTHDVADAWIGYSYLILSTHREGCTGVTSWRIPCPGSDFQPERVIVTP